MRTVNVEKCAPHSLVYISFCWVYHTLSRHPHLTLYAGGACVILVYYYIFAGDDAGQTRVKWSPEWSYKTIPNGMLHLNILLLPYIVLFFFFSRLRCVSFYFYVHHDSLS